MTDKRAEWKGPAFLIFGMLLASGLVMADFTSNEQQLRDTLISGLNNQSMPQPQQQDRQEFQPDTQALQDFLSEHLAQALSWKGIKTIDHQGRLYAPKAEYEDVMTRKKVAEVREKQRYHVSIELGEGKRLRIENLLVNTQAALPVENISVVGGTNGFAIDLSGIEFANATLTAVARQDSLWKCRQWDYPAQQCNGEWVKLADLAPGLPYSIRLSAEDPGFVEFNASTQGTLTTTTSTSFVSVMTINFTPVFTRQYLLIGTSQQAHGAATSDTRFRTFHNGSHVVGNASLELSAVSYNQTFFTHELHTLNRGLQNLTVQFAAEASTSRISMARAIALGIRDADAVSNGTMPDVALLSEFLPLNSTAERVVNLSYRPLTNQSLLLLASAEIMPNSTTQSVIVNLTQNNTQLAFASVEGQDLNDIFPFMTFALINASANVSQNFSLAGQSETTAFKQMRNGRITLVPINGLGSVIFYNESTGSTASTAGVGTTVQNKTLLFFTLPAQMDVLLLGYAELNASATTALFEFDFYVDTTSISNMTRAPKDVTDIYPVLGVNVVNLASGAHTASVGFRNFSGNAWIRNARILAIGINTTALPYMDWGRNPAWSGIGSVRPGSTIRANVTLESAGTNSNATIFELTGNGTSFFSVNQTVLGNFTNGQRKTVEFTCAPTGGQGLGNYITIYQVNSSQNSVGTNITMNCTVSDFAINATVLFPTAGATLDVVQNDTFNFNVSIHCAGTASAGGDCGNVTVFVRYNDTGTAPLRNMSRLFNDTPMFIEESVRNNEIVVTLQSNGAHTGALRILENIKGNLTQKIIWSRPQTMEALDIGDADNDGLNEIVVEVDTLNQLSILDYNESNFSWVETNISNNFRWHIEDLEIGDADNDGDNDIVVGLERTSTAQSLTASTPVRMYSRVGNAWVETNITVTANTTFSETNSVQWIEIGNVDNVTGNEVVALFANVTSDSGHKSKVVIYKNGTSGNWVQINVTPLLAFPFNRSERMELGDVDNDGRDEIVAGFWNDTSANPRGIILKFQNDTGPEWTNCSIMDSVGLLDGISLGDVDQNGTIEAVTTLDFDSSTGTPNQVRMFSNISDTCTGIIETNISPRVSGLGRDVDIGDANNDYFTDVIGGQDRPLFLYENLTKTQRNSTILQFLPWDIANADIDSADIGDPDNDGRLNNISCGVIPVGGVCQINYTIKATGGIGTIWAIDVNATSQRNGLANDSANPFIRITGPAEPGPVFNFSDVSVVKTDSPDPVTQSTQLDYVINVTSNGTGFAYNVTLTDIYPNQTIFLSSQPPAVSGTNNTFVLGNLTSGTSVLVNISVFVLNLTNGTIINNSVNVSFQNETSVVLNRTALETTVVEVPVEPISLYNITGCPITINSTSRLMNEIASAGSCITLNADNIELNCTGFRINFSMATVTGAFGIAAFGRRNVTIRDCAINNGNESQEGVNEHAINFSNTNNSRILNVSILTRGLTGNDGIHFGSSSWNWIANSTITVESTQRDNRGIFLFEFSAGNNITGNNISTMVKPFTTNNTVADHGIDMESFSGNGTHNNTITDNNISTDEAATGSTTAGIQTSNSPHLTVMRNQIRMNNGGGSPPAGIELNSNSFNAIIASNQIFVNVSGAGNNGVRIQGAPNAVIAWNNITINGSSGSPRGIFINNNNHPMMNFTIENNTIIATAGTGIVVNGNNSVVRWNIINTTGDVLTDHDGIFLQTHSNVTIANNSIIARGDVSVTTGSGNDGIVLSGASNTLVADNNITTNGTFNNHGISAGTSGNITIYNNRINSTGANSSHGILTSGTNMTVIGNNITTQGIFSYAIMTQGNSTFFNNTLWYPAQWINLTASPATRNNFTNTTFVTPNGSVNYFGTLSLNGTFDINTTELNITQNLTFLNTTILPMLNASAIISLNGITFTDPRPVVDFEDDGTFTECPATICTELGFSNNIFVFNVTQFTTYAAIESPFPASCPLTINTSVTLVQNITSNTGCVTFGTDNITLDCDGFSISYNSLGGSGDFGVLASGRQNVTVIDCFIRDISSSGSYGIGINLTGTNNSFILNNTILTNGTFDNYGILVYENSLRNIIANNTINTTGSSDRNIGIFINLSSSNNNLTANTIVTNGSRFNTGIRIEQGSNSTLISNSTIRMRQHNGSDNYGLWLFNNIGSTTFANSTILTNGTRDNHGLRLQTNANNNLVAQNNITTRGTSSVNTGILLTSTVSGNRIIGNTINTNGSNDDYGIQLITSASTNSIQFNNISTDGEGSQNYGIHVSTNSFTNNITDNKITTNGTLNNQGIRMESNTQNSIVRGNNISTSGSSSSNHGIILISTGIGNNITANTITTSGTSDNHGIRFQTTIHNNTINLNNITTGGTSTNNYGIYLLGASTNNITANTITTNGNGGSDGIRFELSANLNRLASNTIRTTDSFSRGIELIISNVSLINNTLLNNTVEWVNATPNSFANITNITFDMPNGSIGILPGIIQLNGSFDISKAKLNITFNNSFLNSTNLTFYNTSGRIELRGITFTNPKAVVDFVDDGTFTACPATICTELDFANNVFVFNVTQFTAYASAETGIESCPVAINITTSLTQNLTGNTTCLTLNADNITLDCDGFSIFYNALGGDASFGVLAAGRTNVTVKDCTIIDINESGTFGIGINFSNTNNSFVLNNTIVTNSSGDGTTVGDGYGMLLEMGSARNIVANNTIRTFGNSTNNVGVYLLGGSLNLHVSTNNITNNTIFTNGSDNANGIRLGETNRAARNNTVRFNAISTTGSGVISSNTGIIIDSGSTGNVITNNSIISNGTSSDAGIITSAQDTVVSNNTVRAGGFGIELLGGARSNVTNNVVLATIGAGVRVQNTGADNGTIANNTITTGPAGANNIGIHFFSNVKGFIVGDNTIITNGTSGNDGILLLTNSSANSFINNRITTTGTLTNNRGIVLQNDAHANNFTNTSISTNGSTTSHGIFLVNNANNNSFTLTNITTQSTAGYGIIINNSNSTVFNNTILSNPVQWLNVSSNTVTNFTNLTFDTPDGRIRFWATLPVTVPQDVRKAVLNMTANRAFLNSSNLTVFNTSAIIELRGITFTDPRPIVDFDDDSFFQACPATICSEMSFASNVFVFNVTQFTAYASTETGPVTCPVQINASTNLTQNLSANLTGTTACVTFGTNHTVLECNGNTLYANRSGVGVSATNMINITLQNCVITNFSDGVLWTRVNTSLLLNNTVLNTSDDGMDLVDVNLSRLTGNNVSAVFDNGVVFTRGNFNNLTNNTMELSAGDAFSHGLALFTNTANTLVVNNTFIRNQDDGIQSTGPTNQFFNNTFIANFNDGIQSDGLFATIANNTILGAGDDGIDIGTTTGVNVTFNFIRDVGNIGVTVHNVNATRLEGNSLTNITDDGFFITNGSRQLLIRLNTITNTTSVNGDGISIISNDLPQNNFTIEFNIIGNTSDESIQVHNQSANVTLFANNLSSAGRNSVSGEGIAVTGSREVNATANNITDSNNRSIQVANSHNVTIALNLLHNASSRFIDINDVNTSLIQNNSIVSNNATELRLQLANDTTLLDQRLKNYTFITSALTIRDTGEAEIQYTNRTITQNGTDFRVDLELGFNNVRVNSTNAPGLNQSANISIFGLSMTDPQVLVDQEDDGTFIICPASICTEISYAGGTFFFNVTQFTTYKVREQSVVTVFNQSPVPGALFLLNQTVNISANVTGTNLTDMVLANVTLPNGTVVQVRLINGSALLFNFSWANLTLRGRYNITYFANDTEGTINATTTSFFVRRALAVIDMTDAQDRFINFTIALGTNTSGMLNLNVTPNHTIRLLQVFNHSENSPFSIIKLGGAINESTYPPETNYSIDVSQMNFTLINVTKTASLNGTAYKCRFFNMTTETCIDLCAVADEAGDCPAQPEGLWAELRNISSGQNYTFLLTNSTDPGFAEFNSAQREDEISTNSTIPVTAIEANFTPNTSQVLLIGYAELQGNSTASDVRSQLVFNETDNIGNQSWQPDASRVSDPPGDYQPFFTHQLRNISPTALQNLSVQFFSETAAPANAVFIRRARAIIVGVNASDAVTNETSDVFQGLSPANADHAVLNLSYTPLVNTTALVLASAELNPNRTTQSIAARLTANNTEMARTDVEGEATSDIELFATHFILNATANVTQNFSITARAETTADKAIRRARITIVPLTEVFFNVSENDSISTSSVVQNKTFLFFEMKENKGVIFIATADVNISSATDGNFLGAHLFLNETALANMTVGASDVQDDFSFIAVHQTNLSPGNYTARLTFNRPAGAAGIVVIRRAHLTVIPVTPAGAQPDLFVTGANISFNNTNPRERENITINATVCNIGTAAATGFNVSFRDGNETGGVEISNHSIASLASGACVVANDTYVSIIGNRTICVAVDPPLGSGLVVESNETNNFGCTQLNVQAYTYFFGRNFGNLSLEDAVGNVKFSWNATDNGTVYFFDNDSLFNFSALQALTINTTNGTAVNDLGEANVNLNMTGFNDSIQILWGGGDNSTPLFRRNFTVFGRRVLDVPIINSTNSSLFVTGILWDTQDDTNGEYDILDKEDLVFVANINLNKSGVTGQNIDYEARIPSLLRRYRSAVNNITAVIAELG